MGELAQAEPLLASAIAIRVALKTEPGEENDAVGVAIYFVDEQGIDTFDVDLVAGRNFEATEVAWYDPDGGPRWPGSVIVTRAMANELYPDLATPAAAVGKVAYIEGNRDHPVNRPIVPSMTSNQPVLAARV